MDEQQLQSRTRGCCITAFRSGDVIAAITCRAFRTKLGCYLDWRPLTAYRSQDGQERYSWNLFAKHHQDLVRVSELATEFLAEWEFRPAEAVAHLELEEAQEKVIAAWKKELVAERTAWVEQLRLMQDSRALACSIDPPPSLLGGKS